MQRIQPLRFALAASRGFQTASLVSAPVRKFADTETPEFKQTMNDVIEYFYVLNLSDPVIKHHWDGVDMKNLKKHQHQFVRLAMGKPSTYSGRNMRESHAHLKLTDEDFDHVAANLKKALQEKTEFDDSFINDFITKVDGLRDDVLNR